MHFLTIDVGSYIHYDMLEALKNLGHSYKNIVYSFVASTPSRNEQQYKNKYHNEEIESILEKELKNTDFDAVISTNFYPVIGMTCKKYNVKYLAWSYDTPLNLDTEEGFDLENVYVFMFDREEATRYNKKGYSNFYHLPLAANCKRLNQYPVKPEYSHEISLMGNLYHSMLPELSSIMSDYQKGYLKGIFSSQFPLYGLYIADRVIDDKLVSEINTHYKTLNKNAIQISTAQLNFAFAMEIAHVERITLLRLLSQRRDVHLYTYEVTDSEKEILKKVTIHPPIAYGIDMPSLFKSSKINLNPSLRIIRSAIPLRALDIMGSGGFLFSNYQTELAEFFLDGKEVVMYESIEDAVSKAEFYLKHDDLRQKIAANGHEKIIKHFQFEDRILTMIKIANIH